MTISVGKRAGNAIVPYSQATRRTTLIDISSGGENKVVGVTSGLTIDEATIMFFMTSDNQWFMDFKIYGPVSPSNSTITATLTDITTNTAAGSWPLVAMPGDSAGYRAWIPSADNTVTQNSSSNSLYFRVTNGSPIPIQSLPSYAIPYLEASTDASIYIEPASATQAGIVDTNAQSFDGLKTFNSGVKIDTINEKTSGNGVIIDGVTLKDGEIVAPQLQVSTSSSQEVPDATSTVITTAFGTPSINPTGDWNGTTGRFTPSVAGKYFVSMNGVYLTPSVAPSAVDKYINVGIYKNGSRVAANATQMQTTSTHVVRGPTVTSIVECNGTTDYIEIKVYQNINSGVTMYVAANDTWTTLSIFKLP